MSLNYDKSKRDLLQGNGSWRSYSYIATVTSLLFLLLYIVAVVRQTSIAVSEKAQSEKKGQAIAQLNQKVQDLEKQKTELEAQRQRDAQMAVLRRQAELKRDAIEENRRRVQREKQSLEKAVAQMRKGKLKRLSVATRKKIEAQIVKMKSQSAKRVSVLMAQGLELNRELEKTSNELAILSESPRSPSAASAPNRKGP